MVDTPMILIISCLAIVLGGLMMFFMFVGKKGQKTLNKEYYQAKCLENEHNLKQGDVQSYHLCLINGDKLVDQALKEKGVKGETMAERLKNTANLYSDRNGIWLAHKLRNVVVHEANATVNYEQTRQALLAFKRALKDLGAI